MIVPLKSRMPYQEILDHVNSYYSDKVKQFGPVAQGQTGSRSTRNSCALTSCANCFLRANDFPFWIMAAGTLCSSAICASVVLCSIIEVLTFRRRCSSRVVNCMAAVPTFNFFKTRTRWNLSTIPLPAASLTSNWKQARKNGPSIFSTRWIK